MSLRSALGISILTIDVFGSTWGLGDVDVPTWFGRKKSSVAARVQMSKIRRGRLRFVDSRHLALEVSHESRSLFYFELLRIPFTFTSASQTRHHHHLPSLRH